MKRIETRSEMLFVSARQPKIDPTGGITRRFKNILNSYPGGAEQALAEGRMWYPSAYQICVEISKNEGRGGIVSPEKVAGIIAVTSPELEWAINVRKAKEIINYYMEHGEDFIRNPRAEIEPQEQYEEIQEIDNEQHPEQLNFFEFNSNWLSGPWTKERGQDPVFATDPDVGMSLKNSANLRMAFNILTENDYEQFITGPKVSAFYKNIIGDTSAVTIDSIMTKAAGKEKLGESTRRAIDKAVRTVANQYGETPRDTQAAIWIAYPRQRALQYMDMATDRSGPEG